MKLGALPENVLTTSNTITIQKICSGSTVTKYGEDVETNP